MNPVLLSGSLQTVWTCCCPSLPGFTKTCAEAWLAPDREVMHVAALQGFREGTFHPVTFHEGYAVAQWLRHCATNRKVADSIPDGVTGIFH
jgi:hypothetical protein